MKCTSYRYNGFTLVEISIVMIIIGLLIGGTFGGMKLIENMQVNKTVQDLKAIESAALTFKDTYGRLPGDIVNPASRLPACTVAPCATGGNGNRIMGAAGLNLAAIPAPAEAQENVTFWSHLQAADVLSVGTRNVSDSAFGAAQPDNQIGGGFRLFDASGAVIGSGCTQIQRTAVWITSRPTAAIGWDDTIPCSSLSSIDTKIDDGRPAMGTFKSAWGCDSSGSATCTDTYLMSGSGASLYDLKGF